MPYCHETKCGNQGDLIKHFALAKAIDHITPGSSEFNYLDVHCGRANYTLKPGGAWEQGIGTFVRRYSSNLYRDDELDRFYRLLGSDKLTTQLSYPGSSSIVYSVLNDKEINNINLHLCDTSADICTSLEKSYQSVDQVHIYCEDGYRKAKQLTDLDLVFIDPPDMDEHFPAYLDLLHYCLHRGQPFISWNSLHGNAAGDDMSAACQQIGKLARTTDTAQLTVKWHPGWPGAMCGCQMLFGLPGAGKLPASCQSLARLMQWAIIA